MSWSFASLLLAATLSAAPATSAPPLERALDESPPPDRVSIDFVVLGNLEGVLARPDCSAPSILPDANRHYAQLVSAYRALAAAGKKNGREPVALNLGDAIFPGSFSRYLITRGSLGSESLVEILGQIPYALVGVGNHELAPPRDETDPFVRAAQGKLPVHLANIECAPDSKVEWCRLAPSATEPGYAVVERGGLRIGLTAVLDPNAKETLSPSQLEGLKLLDPAEVLPRLAEKMRKDQKVDLVVVTYHSAGANGSARLEALAPKLNGVDLVIANLSLGGETTADETGVPRRKGYWVAPGSGTFLIGTDGGRDALFTLKLRAERSGGESWSIGQLTSATLSTVNQPPDAATGALLEGVARKYCDDWGIPLRPEMELSKSFDFSDFTQMTLNTMRSLGDTEIALINAGTFRNSSIFPLKESVTRANIYATMPYDSELVTFRLPGDLLKKLAPRLGTDVLAAGVEKDADGNLKVNGRPIDTARVYSVASNKFLAEGGDDLLSPKPSKITAFHPDWADEEAPPINELMVHFLESGRYTGKATRLLAEPSEPLPPLTPMVGFPDLHQRLLWRYLGSVTAAYNRVAVTNPSPAQYQSSDLNASSEDDIKFELKLSANADSRDHGWNNELLVQYATLRDRSVSTHFQENQDLIRFTSAYQLLWIRSTYGDAFYMPAPRVEGQLETEFDKQPGAAWHKLLLTGIIGTSFHIFKPLDIKVGFNVMRDINAPPTDPSGKTTVGLNLGYSFTRYTLATFNGRDIQFESNLDYFFNDLGGQDINILRSTNKLLFGLFDKLSFTAGFNAYFYRSRIVGQPGTSLQYIMGFNYLFDAYSQMR